MVIQVDVSLHEGLAAPGVIVVVKVVSDWKKRAVLRIKVETIKKVMGLYSSEARVCTSVGPLGSAGMTWDIRW